MDTEILRKLETRLGPLHARQRLGIETDHEAQVFGQGLTFFHLENWYTAPAIIRIALKLMGLYWRARKNAERILVKRNDVRFANLPPAFDGFKILHISDLHVDMNEVAMQHGRTFGPATFDGAWKYHNMTGYTSVGAGSSVLPVRLNCPPEITLHCLRHGLEKTRLFQGPSGTA